MSNNKRIRLVNMTSTQIFKNQAENIYSSLRHDNTSDGSTTFAPTHMGGVPGQRGILVGKNVMRETTVTPQ